MHQTPGIHARPGFGPIPFPGQGAFACSGGVWAGLHAAGVLVLLAIAAGVVWADTPEAAADAFADQCFSPFMTADRADEVLAQSGARVDFYDLDPFSSVDPSPATGRQVTTGTDRRCEVAFDGTHVAAGIASVERGLAQEGIATEADVPAGFPAMDGTEFIAARQLNPNRIAIVQVGTRPGPNGVETFINVERLIPLNE